MIDAGTREWTKVPGGARPETGTRKRMGRAEDVARRRRRKEVAAALEGGRRGGQDPGWGCELRGSGAVTALGQPCPPSRTALYPPGQTDTPGGALCSRVGSAVTPPCNPRPGEPGQPPQAALYLCGTPGTAPSPSRGHSLPPGSAPTSPQSGHRTPARDGVGPPQSDGDASKTG